MILLFVVRWHRINRPQLYPFAMNAILALYGHESAIAGKSLEMTQKQSSENVVGALRERVKEKKAEMTVEIRKSEVALLSLSIFVYAGWASNKWMYVFKIPTGFHYTAHGP